MEDAGAALTLPETIGDFTFSHGYDVAATAKSATGKSEQVDELNAEYEKDGVTLNFNAHKTYTVFSEEENSDPEPDEVQEVNGVTLSFRDSLRSARLRAERRGKETGAPRRADHQRGLGRGRGQAVPVGKLAEGRHELFSVRL